MMVVDGIYYWMAVLFYFGSIVTITLLYPVDEDIPLSLTSEIKCNV